jgi:hypothetical protein
VDHRQRSLIFYLKLKELGPAADRVVRLILGSKAAKDSNRASKAAKDNKRVNRAAKDNKRVSRMIRDNKMGPGKTKAKPSSQLRTALRSLGLMVTRLQIVTRRRNPVLSLIAGRTPVLKVQTL